MVGREEIEVGDAALVSHPRTGALTVSGECLINGGIVYVTIVPLCEEVGCISQQVSQFFVAYLQLVEREGS